MRKILIAAAMAVASTTQGYAMDSLSQYHWKNRVVLIFGQSDDPKVGQQIDTLKKQQAELADRAMVVIRVGENDTQTIYGAAAKLDNAAVRSESKVSDGDFHVVLIGKDGGIKLRSERVIGDVEMFDLIDRMPMRRAGQG